MVALLRIADKIELNLRGNNGEKDSLIQSISDGTDGLHVGIQHTALHSLWDDLVESRDNALGMFGS